MHLLNPNNHHTVMPQSTSTKHNNHHNQHHRKDTIKQTYADYGLTASKKLHSLQHQI
jgi:hypothetical protein